MPSATRLVAWCFLMRPLRIPSLQLRSDLLAKEEGDRDGGGKVLRGRLLSSAVGNR